MPVDVTDTNLLNLSVGMLQLFSIEFFFRWFGYDNAIEKPKNAMALSLCTFIPRAETFPADSAASNFSFCHITPHYLI